jgi:hypothetical protein
MAQFMLRVDERTKIFHFTRILGVVIEVIDKEGDRRSYKDINSAAIERVQVFGTTG